MTTDSRVICNFFHDDIFIAKAVRASDDYLGIIGGLFSYGFTRESGQSELRSLLRINKQEAATAEWKQC